MIKQCGVVLLTLGISQLACDKFLKKAASDVKLETDEQKASYAIGVQIGKGMKAQGLTVDSAIIGVGIGDVLADKGLKLSEEELQGSMQKMRDGMQQKRTQEGEANVQKGKAFLEENKKKEGVKVTASGLQYEVIMPGKGPKPKASSTVRVHYKGTLIDGTEFDSSYARNEPAEFPVEGVIKGWTEALQLMQPGAKWRLVIPSELAYGPQGRPNIPANSVLVFEVELLEIKK